MWKHVWKTKGLILYFKMLWVHLHSGRTNDSFPGLQTPCRVSAGHAVQQLMQNKAANISAPERRIGEKHKTKREKTGEEVRSHLSIKLISKGRYLTAHVRSPFHSICTRSYRDTWSCFKTPLSALSCPLFQIGALSASRNSTHSIPVTVLRHHQRLWGHNDILYVRLVNRYLSKN